MHQSWVCLHKGISRIEASLTIYKKCRKKFDRLAQKNGLKNSGGGFGTGRHSKSRKLAAKKMDPISSRNIQKAGLFNTQIFLPNASC